MQEKIKAHHNTYSAEDIATFKITMYVLRYLNLDTSKSVLTFLVSYMKRNIRKFSEEFITEYVNALEHVGMERLSQELLGSLQNRKVIRHCFRELVNALLLEGYRVQVSFSQTTNSIYIKPDYGLYGRIRISDHKPSKSFEQEDLQILTVHYKDCYFLVEEGVETVVESCISLFNQKRDLVVKRDFQGSMFAYNFGLNKLIQEEPRYFFVSKLMKDKRSPA